MIRPIIKYGDIVFDNITISQSEQLEKIQRRAALICTGAYRHTEHVTLLREVGWEPLSDRRRFHRLVAYYKMLNGPCPPHISNILPHLVANLTTYNLRNRQKIRPKFCRLNSSLKSFFPRTTRDWNLLPEETKLANSIHIFKRLIHTTESVNPYYLLHKGRGGIYLSRIRMGLSGLNAHRFTYNMIPSPDCSYCKNEPETTIHYLWLCPKHIQMRDILVDRIRAELDIQVNRVNILDMALHGKIDKLNQNTLLNIVIEYINSTKRFN
jgi:hypothetical protein